MSQKEFILDQLKNDFGPLLEKVQYIFDPEDHVHFVRIFPIKLREVDSNKLALSDLIIKFEDAYPGHYISVVGEESLIQFSDEDIVFNRKKNYAAMSMADSYLVSDIITKYRVASTGQLSSQYLVEVDTNIASPKSVQTIIQCAVILDTPSISASFEDQFCEPAILQGESNYALAA